MNEDLDDIYPEWWPQLQESERVRLEETLREHLVPVAKLMHGLRLRGLRLTLLSNDKEVVVSAINPTNDPNRPKSAAEFTRIDGPTGKIVRPDEGCSTPTS